MNSNKACKLKVDLRHRYLGGGDEQLEPGE
jgi:hypothetical protein